MVDRDKFNEHLCTLYEIISRYDIEEFRKYESELEQKKSHFNVNVLFVGHFNAGKSSLLNRLIERRKYLAEDQGPKTAIATELYYGEDKYVAVKANGEKTIISDIKNLDISSVAYVEAHLLSENLKKISDFTIVDTPGFDSRIENHNKALANYLGTGAAYVLVIDAEKGGIDNISLPFLREISEYSSQIAILINKCDKQTTSNIEKIKQSAENTLSMYGFEYPVYCVSKHDEGIELKLIELINSFSAQDAFDFQMKNEILLNAKMMKDTINVLQKKLYLDTYELDNTIYNYTQLQQQLTNTVKTKKEEIYDNSTKEAERIMNEIESSLNEKTDMVADAILHGGAGAVNAIVLEAVRPVLIRSFKDLAVAQIDDLVTTINIDILNSNKVEDTDDIQRIIEATSEKIKALINNGNFEKMVDFEEISGVNKNNNKSKSGNGVYHLVTGILTLIDGVVCPPELFIVLLPEIIAIVKSIFGESERTKIIKAYNSAIIPQVMSKLRIPVEKSVENNQKTMIELLEQSIKQKLTVILDEIEKAKLQKEKNISDFNNKETQYANDIKLLDRIITVFEEV